MARSYFAALPLSNGTVLVVGHDNNCTPGGANGDSVETELYDPTSGTWATTQPLNAPRDGFAAATLKDGRVLVTGGLTSVTDTSGVVAYSSARIYDPATGKWTKPGLMHVARYRPSASVLADGTVLVAGGMYVDETRLDVKASAELFDPATGTWSLTGAMKTPRYGAPAVTLRDGRVLVAGGLGADDKVLRSAEIYDPGTGKWAPAGSMSVPRDAFTLTLLPDSSVLAVGGESEASWSGGKPLASTERFDPASGTWSRAASMASPRSEHVAALLGDGRLLVAGGNDRARRFADPDVGFPDPTASAEIYDPVADTWTATEPMGTPRAAASAVGLPDGSVLVTGGYGSWGAPSTPYCPDELASAERYVPADG